MTKALFLDIGGVVNKDKNHLYKTEEFETCRYFQKKKLSYHHNYKSIWHCRGKYTDKDFKVLTNWMIAEFKKNIKKSKGIKKYKFLN